MKRDIGDYIEDVVLAMDKAMAFIKEMSFEEFAEDDKSVPMRYPENVISLEKQFSMKLARDYLKKTKEVLRWLKQNLAQLK